MSKAYLVGMMDITDGPAYQAYKAGTPKVLRSYGGDFLSRGGDLIVLEGIVSSRVVIAEFPSVDKARGFYNSPEYLQLRRKRENSANMNLFIVSGHEE